MIKQITPKINWKTPSTNRREYSDKVDLFKIYFSFTSYNEYMQFNHSNYKNEINLMIIFHYTNYY